MGRKVRAKRGTAGELGSGKLTARKREEDLLARGKIFKTFEENNDLKKYMVGAESGSGKKKKNRKKGRKLCQGGNTESAWR